MSLTIVRGSKGASLPFTSSAPSEYKNPFVRRLDYQRYWLLKLDVHQQRISELRVTESSDNASIESDVRVSLENLRSLVATISQGEALASTDEFDRLLSLAVQHHGAPENIAEWANRVTSDADKLKD